jgi:hypothetical protein
VLNGKITVSDGLERKREVAVVGYLRNHFGIFLEALRKTTKAQSRHMVFVPTSLRYKGEVLTVRFGAKRSLT